jgi:hypothetical protein
MYVVFVYTTALQDNARYRVYCPNAMHTCSTLQEVADLIRPFREAGKKILCITSCRCSTKFCWQQLHRTVGLKTCLSSWTSVVLFFFVLSYHVLKKDKKGGASTGWYEVQQPCRRFNPAEPLCVLVGLSLVLVLVLVSNPNPNHRCKSHHSNSLHTSPHHSWSWFLS